MQILNLKKIKKIFKLYWLNLKTLYKQNKENKKISIMYLKIPLQYKINNRNPGKVFEDIIAYYFILV